MIEDQIIHIGQPSLQRRGATQETILKLGSFNIQKTRDLATVAQTGAHFDILLLQEFKATRTNIEVMHDYARSLDLTFYSTPSRTEKVNMTGILIKKSSIRVLGSYELGSYSLYSDRATDIRIETVTGDHLLVQNLYLPTSDKQLQAEIIRETQANFRHLKDQHPTLQLFYGGDLNHSIDDNTSSERTVRLAINELDNVSGTEDVAKWDRRISKHPTNVSYQNCRRIDRFHAPRNWRQRARCYKTYRHPVITTSHFVIILSLVLDNQSRVHVGKRRFVFPLRRILLPYANKAFRKIPTSLLINEAIFLITSEGLDYIKFMGTLRRMHPRLAAKMISDGRHILKGEYQDQATKAFFQHKRQDPTIYQKVTNAATGTEADDTLGMLEVATEYYRDLYKAPPQVPDSDLQQYLSPVTSQLNDFERATLNRPFTKEELLIAVKGMEKSAAPGADGVQLPVIEYLWESLGPILTREANNIMRTGNLPQNFKKVLITLIPKRGKEGDTDIANLRPISLTNTTLKIVSSAACRRLQKVLDKLIGPNQRGFIKGRFITHNTMEFFTMVRLLKERKDRDRPSYYQAILMADFTKAFDRISHQYINATLEKMELGTKMTGLLMLILKGQFGQIVMNNCGGDYFPLDCGTRQGNPLSPLLFNIALEPFLLHLKILEGVKLSYGDISLGQMQYHAFADDVNIYLLNLLDYQKTARCIKDFERVSNSLVSQSKSKLIGFYNGYSRKEQDILPYPQSYIGREDTQYLGIRLKGVDWLRFIKNLPFMTHKQGYRGLDTINKALGTNMFVSSKTVYKDLVQCMTAKELKKIDVSIQRMFQGIGADKLYARPKKGGFGVIELKVQLQGHRAKVLARTLGDDQLWYVKYMRAKMLHHVVKIFHQNPRANIRNSQGLDWADFLFEANGRYFENLEWTFTPNEIHYINAWKQLVKGSRITHPYTIASRARIEDVSAILSLRGIPSDSERKMLRTGIFKSQSKQRQEKKPPIMPGRFREICPEARPIKKWDKFWKALYKEEWIKRNELGAIHLFNIGSYVPQHDERPSRAAKCLLCLKEVTLDVFLQHIYNECAISQYWWNHLGFPRAMNLREMLAPEDTSFDNLRKLNWFVKIVRITYKGRRQLGNEGVTLPELLNRALRSAMRRVTPMGQ